VRRRTIDPRLQRRPPRLAEVFESHPEVLAHNVETVPRNFKRIRPAFAYHRSLGVITAARASAWSPRATSSSGSAKPPTRCTPPWPRHRHHRPIPASVERATIPSNAG
jgi:hypothetical protein